MSKKSVVGTTSVGILSSILAFLGVVSCCGMPIIAGILAWLGIGASQLSFFAEYRSLFIGIAIVALLFGFWQVYFKKAFLVVPLLIVVAELRRKTRNLSLKYSRRFFVDWRHNDNHYADYG